MGWSGYKNHCYKLVKRAAKWEEAKKQCEQLGANLASITSYGEANFINTIITDAPVGKWGVHFVWFGLHRNGGFEKFTDGSKVSYANWEPGQPNDKRHLFSGYEGQDCVGIYSKTGRGIHTPVHKGQWNDDQCYRTFPFICKRPK
ncbi:PREDICTED: snaclec agkisacutacin subunit A-like [Branchiostoma belcheri]|uniref:Snaclec agkisacutacin subunit A-like n=1 Tax=Branchiostoma belcheri TaxID=7741 RepID=A0A6P4Z449_BRABE|nr:PREDICTED: snaclec agkisacutacin subunit A-like [Branchiostoma belcheri]